MPTLLFSLEAKRLVTGEGSVGISFLAAQLFLLSLSGSISMVVLIGTPGIFDETPPLPTREGHAYKRSSGAL